MKVGDGQRRHEYMWVEGVRFNVYLHQTFLTWTGIAESQTVRVTAVSGHPRNVRTMLSRKARKALHGQRT